MNMKILASDGLHPTAIDLLTNNGFEVSTTKVAQEQVANYVNKNDIEILIINHGTHVDANLLKNTKNLKAVAKLTNDFENIDLKVADELNIKVFKVKKATIQSQAELIIAHLMSGARNLHQTNREMPLEGDVNFKHLQKHFKEGLIIKGKTLGLIGFDLVAQEVAKMAYCLGIKIIVYESKGEPSQLEINFFDHQKINFNVSFCEKQFVLKNSDFISIHQEEKNEYIIDETDFKQMKLGTSIINIQKGKIIDEIAMVDALNHDVLKFAGLDAFENQPHPEIQLLMHPQISLSPNISSYTKNMEENNGIEIAKVLIENFITTH